jgi:hypothetical protein
LALTQASILEAASGARGFSGASVGPAGALAPRPTQGLPGGRRGGHENLLKPQEKYLMGDPFYIL